MTFYCYKSYDKSTTVLKLCSSTSLYLLFLLLIPDSLILEHNISLQSLSPQLGEKHVEFCAVSSPPVLSADQNNDIKGLSCVLGSSHKCGEL